VSSLAHVLALPKQKKKSSLTYRPKIKKVDIYWYILYYFVRFCGLMKEKGRLMKEREKERK